MSFGVCSFNEGSGILPTLDSLYGALVACGLGAAELILSDSSTTPETVGAAEAWSKDKDLRLLIDRSETRRSLKEARNVIFERAKSDILVQVVADVIIEPASLHAMLAALTTEPRPEVVIGIARPDPQVRGLCQRASAWQLKASARATTLLPTSRLAAEGAFWGCWRSFYASFRLQNGTGVVDDVELTRHLVAHAVPAVNCTRAVAYKVPAGTLDDFHLQTQRSFATLGRWRRSPNEFVAAVIETVKDPLGAALYVCARLWSARRRRRFPVNEVERWPIAFSTKRRAP